MLWKSMRLLSSSWLITCENADWSNESRSAEETRSSIVNDCDSCDLKLANESTEWLRPDLYVGCGTVICGIGDSSAGVDGDLVKDGDVGDVGGDETSIESDGIVCVGFNGAGWNCGGWVYMCTGCGLAGDELIDDNKGVDGVLAFFANGAGVESGTVESGLKSLMGETMIAGVGGGASSEDVDAFCLECGLVL